MQAIKAWGHNSPRQPKPLQTCNIIRDSSKKFWAFENEACNFTTLSCMDQPRVKRYEKYLKQCNLNLCGVVEAVLFDDILGEMERVVASGLNENEVILVNSVDMYIIIEEERTLKIRMNYKTVDKNVKPMDTPMVDRSLGDPQGIGYRFIDET